MGFDLIFFFRMPGYCTYSIMLFESCITCNGDKKLTDVLQIFRTGYPFCCDVVAKFTRSFAYHKYLRMYGMLLKRLFLLYISGKIF
jgi:hypothetical protein